MKRLWGAAIVVTALGVLFLILARGHGTDEPPYNEMVTIKGKVEIINHRELGRTPGSGIYLLFQRDDCKRCLIATSADAEGSYQIRVGRGRYKIMVDNPNPTYNLLAPDQPRFIEANSVVKENEFDIKLMLPSGR